MHSELHAHWNHAHRLLGANPTASFLQHIVGAYGGDSRHYHGIPHLMHGLMVLDNLFREIPGTSQEDIALAKLVFFFHDIVYERLENGQPSNEQQSADIFESYCVRACISKDLVRRGCYLILATADHQGTDCADSLWPFINDADLAVFGASATAYGRYSEGVWREFSYVGRRAFVEARTNFLKNFKEKPIFRTAEMRKFEPIAIQNIENEISSLAAEAQSVVL